MVRSLSLSLSLSLYIYIYIIFNFIINFIFLKEKKEEYFGTLDVGSKDPTHPLEVNAFEDGLFYK
jgi:hypothetical protein